MNGVDVGVILFLVCVIVGRRFGVVDGCVVCFGGVMCFVGDDGRLLEYVFFEDCG